MADARALTHFIVKFFPAGLSHGEALLEYEGGGDDWHNYRQIKLPGFDGTQTINCDDLWQQVFSQYPDKIQIDVVGYETIVKYGNTQQLKEKFTAVANFYYE